jgi:hypothetical protein
MLYVGIDPGEVWCGFAALLFDANGDIRAEARSHSIAAHGGYLGMVRDLVDLIPHARQTRLIVEDFRIRASGHQRFNHGNTLRMLGALEYASSKIPTFSWYLVSPGSSRDTHNLFGKTLRNYHKRWPNPGDDAWTHCMSAWRVLGHHLLKHDTAGLTRLRMCKPVRVSRWLPLGCNTDHDLIAPAARMPFR